MIAEEKIYQLQSVIRSVLTPIINRNYWLLEVPYYSNIGDTLIWQGELDFLRSLTYKCIGMRSFYSRFPQNIKPEDTIIFQGGGNFGDIWLEPQEYRMRVIRQYPDNKVIIFPQTVWFEHEDNMQECARILSQCKNLTICARDIVSYEILRNNFSNNILLVPDMAFCIDMSKWKTYSATKEVLLLKREDKELKMTDELLQIENTKDVTVTDWPTFTEDSWQKRWFWRTKKYVPGMFDLYARIIFRPYLINSGIQLISSYKKVYSTRLHAAILSVLLGKASDLVWYDNSYGKNKNFYETWLKDCEGIQFVDNK